MAESDPRLVDDDRAINLDYELRHLGIVNGLQVVENSNDAVDISASDILQQALCEASQGMERANDNFDSMDGAIRALSEVTKDIDGDKNENRAILPSYDENDHPDLATSIPFYSMESSQHVPLNEAEPLPQEMELNSLLNSTFQKTTDLQTNSHFDENQPSQITSGSTTSFINTNLPASVSLTNTGTAEITFSLNTQAGEPSSPAQTFSSSLQPNGAEKPGEPDEPLTKEDSPPLGSSQNPIQIIQQGTTYHSTQNLTAEQLQQIAHVLQQQHSTKVAENGILYNSATNTRIVYRVVYPSQQAKETEETDENKAKEDKKLAANRNRGRPRRTWTKKMEEDFQLGEGPDMSKEEKEEKKKHRPRTRSGRISKPPSYMIKDYKRIHHLDFNEEPYDDSDGGYSDFRQSDEEGSCRPTTPTLPPGVSTIKARNYKCTTCEKAYIGRGGLARHLRLHVDHGTMPEGEENDCDMSDENSNGSAISFGSSFPVAQEAKKSEPTKPVPSTKPTKSPENTRKYSNQQLAYFARRRAKLKELLRPYQDEEVMDSVLPRLAQIVTLWEFLLKKSEKGDPPLPHVPDLLRHFEQLLKHLQKLAKDCLVLSNLNGSAPHGEIPNADSTSLTGNEENKIYVEITSDNVAQVLGLSTGLYEVQQNKLLEELPTLTRRKRRHVVKRVHRSDPNGKRFCMDRVLQGSATMSDSIGMSDSIDLTIPDPILGNSASDDNHLDLNQLISDNIRDEMSNSTMEGVQKRETMLDSTDAAVSSAFCSLGKADAVLSSTVVSSMLESSSSQNNHLDSSLLFTSLSQGISNGKSSSASRNPTSTLTTAAPNKTVLDSFKGTIEKKPDESLRFLTKKVKIGENKTGDLPKTGGPDEPPESKLPQELPKTISVSDALELVSGEKDCAKDAMISISGLGEMTLSNEAFQQAGPKGLCEQSNDALIRDMCSGETVELVSQDILKAVTESSGPASRNIGEVISTTFGNASNDTPVIRLVVPDSSSLGPLSPVQLELPGVNDSLTTPNFLPGNIMVVQNPDGTTTLQITGDQALPMETIQALLGMDHTITLDPQIKGMVDH